jgi:hypothetical protein
MQFSAVCSKWNKKLTLSLSAWSLDEARTILHGQGYSIIELHPIDSKEQNISEDANFFFFDIYINGELKTWKIQSDDIFKSYKKLIEDLSYDVVYIYTHEWMGEEQKKIITAKVKDTYAMYKSTQWEEVKQEKKETEKEKEMKEISSWLVKEIDFYSKIIDSTIVKIQDVFTKYSSIVTPTKRSDLEKLQQILQQSKGSSNIQKLKMLLEDTLKLIWQIELEVLKAWMIQERKKFLESTNSLLKQIWSNERIKEEEKKKEEVDVNKALNGLFDKISSKKKEEKKLDTNSFVYYKNQRELNLYRERLNKTDFQILKAFFTFKFEDARKLLLKKKLILQNIQIIDNRIHNKTISYTKIVHGFRYYTDIIVGWIANMSDIWVYSLLLYTYAYIIINTLSYAHILQITIEPKSFLFVSIFACITLIFSFIRNIFFLIIWIPVMIFIFSFLSINF